MLRLIDLFPQGGIKLNRRIKIKDERLKRTCMPHTFKTVLKVRRGNTLAGIYEMVYPIILPSKSYKFPCILITIILSYISSPIAQ